MASPLDSPFLVNRRLRLAVWPPNETAKLVQRCLESFYGYDRWPPTTVRNRHSDLVDLIISVSNGGREPPNETAEVPLFSRDSILRLRSAAWLQNETADR